MGRHVGGQEYSHVSDVTSVREFAERGLTCIKLRDFLHGLPQHYRLGFAYPFDPRPAHSTWANRIAPNVLAAQLDCKSLRESAHCPLCGRIGAPTRHTKSAGS